MNSNTKFFIAVPLVVIVSIFSYMSFTDVERVVAVEKEDVISVEIEKVALINNTNVASSEIKEDPEKENIILNENNVEQEPVSQVDEQSEAISNKDNQYLLIIMLGLISLISLSTTFWLYRWRRVIVAGKDIVVPETFAKQVNGIVQAVNGSSSELGKVINQQSGAVNQFSGSLKSLDENIKGMIDTYMSLQAALDQKDEEIVRFKDGYDSKIFHNFLLRFTRVDRVIQEYLEDGKIDLKGLRDIREVMEDALEECGVELFSPNTGEGYLDLDGIAANPKKIDTKDESQNLTICEVIKAGYRRKLPNSKFEIITQAKVSIFVYKVESQQSEELQTDEKLEE